MKAIKYSRFIQTWHWSQSVGENFIFIPESNAILYNGSTGDKKYAGITSDSKFTDEAREYISRVQNAEIKKHISEEHQKIQEQGFNINKNYSAETLMAKDKRYIYEIPKHEGENVISYPVLLSDYEEIEIDVNPKIIKELFQRQMDFTMKKAAFEAEKKSFEETISNINNLIIKQ